MRHYFMYHWKKENFTPLILWSIFISEMLKYESKDVLGFINAPN